MGRWVSYQIGSDEKNVADIKQTIRDKARAEGFDEVGFCDARADPKDAEALARFLGNDWHGEMAWLDNADGRRGDPQALLAEARTAIVVAANYGPADDPMAILAHPERGAISVYAQAAKDYHDLMKKRLKRLGRWIGEELGGDLRVYVDTAPVMEKPLAARAGLGWQGKHSNLVSKRFGSWLFLGEILSTLEIPPDRPEADHCGSCDKCRTVCPTGAIPAPYQLEARRCISYLTIEHKTAIAPDLMAAMGNHIYGCDDCLAVCPWNKFAKPTSEAAFLPRAELRAPRLADLAQLDDAAFRQLFAGSPIKRTGRERFVRNVLIAIGNSADASLAETATRLRDDPSPLVADAADWAAGRLAALDR